MVDKISVQIALQGGDEVEKQLAAIGKAGDQAFAGLNEEGTKAAEGINKTGEAADKAAESTSRLSLATIKTSAEIAAATAKFALHSVEIVQAVRHHDTLIQSLLKLVSGFNTATRVVAAFTPELALVGVTVGSTAAAVLAGLVAFEALEKVITKVAAADEKLNNRLQTLAATSGKSFDELQRGEATFKQIGISVETFRGSIAKIQETLAGTDVTNLTRGMKDIVALVNQIAAGDKTITFANWVTAEDKIKGVAIAMKQAADSGKDATTVLLEFIRNVDLASAIKIGAAFGLSEADVDRVRRLNENISDLVQRIKGAPPLISPENAAAFDRLRTSMQNVESARARFAQAFTTMDFKAMAANFSATMHEMEAAVTSAAAAIVERMGTAFNGMMSQAKSDIAEIGAALQDLAQKTGALSLFKQMQADAVTANATIANFVGGLMRGFGAAEASIKAVQDRINGIEPALNTAGQAAQQSGVMFTAWGTVIQQSANTAQASVEQGVQIWTQWGTAASQNGEKAKAAMDAAAGSTQSLSDKVGELISKLASNAWDAFKQAGVAAWDAIIAKVREFLGLRPTGGGAAAAAGGGQFAGGGMIGGRGTGTSDSNLAWVSRGEYITPARAVAQPGVLAFLEALRRSGGNLSRVLDGMGRFALGGMVPRMPAFAAGGSVGSMSHVTIAFPGLPAISGLRASSDVVDQLHRAAALAQVRSGGRKPSRYS